VSALPERITLAGVELHWSDTRDVYESDHGHEYPRVAAYPWNFGGWRCSIRLRESDVIEVAAPSFREASS